jgi:hypothetical protein
MESLLIQATDDSPEVLFSPENRKFCIQGKSLPEDVESFYNPILEWIKAYSKNPLDETVIEFKFTYFNTATSKIILDILMLFEDIQADGHKVKVNWFYPEYDEDMMEAGHEYSDMVEIPFEHFQFVPVI